MDEFSLYVLDITMNSVRAGATDIEIELIEQGPVLTFRVKDNGCGMTQEQVDKLKDPFFTTRKTRKVGLGIPFLTMLSRMTGGEVSISSKHESEGEGHGTRIEATFGKDHIDFIPLGDMVQTVKTLIQGAPEIDFVYRHTTEQGEVLLCCEELREVLGEVPLSEPEVLQWIEESLYEQYRELKEKK